MAIFPGLDASGNGNDWTTNNINNTNSTATTYDIMTDVPKLTDTDTANYCVMNPLDKNTSATISNGNLTQDASASAWRAVRSTYFVSSGKWYWETTISGSGVDIGIIGISNASATLANIPDANAYGYNGSNGQKYTSSTNTAYGATYASGDIIGIALDMDAGTLTFYKNNTSQGTAFTSLSGLFSPTFWQYAGYTNFGQRPFAYTPPTGYLKLNTFNLPDSSIVDGSENFGVGLWTGNGSASGPSVTNLNFKPELLWSKSRSTVANNYLYDIVRSPGDSPNKFLGSNTTDAEQTFNAFTLTDTGFNLATTNVYFNQASATYAAWNWKAGGTAVSNTAGTITSQVSANPTAGFSIATYTGTGNIDTVGHGLNVEPDILIVKTRTQTQGWIVYTKLIDGSNDALFLDTTAAAGNSGFSGATPTVFNFSVGASAYSNTAGQNYVMYSFASVEGYSKMGKYTGNGSADGPFVYTGFRPAFLMFKTTTIIGHWVIVDTERSTYNVIDDSLYPDTNGSEINTITDVDFLSNGFKWRGVLANETNVNGQVYIYMAFAENPFKNSLAR
jgi:hypothetical protein